VVVETGYALSMLELRFFDRNKPANPFIKEEDVVLFLCKPPPKLSFTGECCGASYGINVLLGPKSEECLGF
jgi:hypothetical protein